MIVTNNSEHSEFISKILFGKDTPWFESFKHALSQEGINIIGVTVTPSSESHFVRNVNGEYFPIPILNLYAFGDDGYRIKKLKNDVSGVIDPCYDEKVNGIWRTVCEQYNVDTDLYCGIGACIYVGIAEGIMCSNVIRSSVCISEVRNTLLRLCGRQPINIYCSTLPSYNIVFSQSDYIAADIDGKKELLTQAVCDIVKPHLKEACHGADVTMPLKVNFFHPQMTGYNEYGLARQD